MAAHLGEHLSGAFKEILKEELQGVRELQTRHGERLDALETALRGLSDSVVQRAQQDSESLRAEFGSQLSSLGAQLRDERESLGASLTARLDRHETDTDGLWGLQLLREKVEGVSEMIAQHREESQMRADDLGGLLQGVRKQCEEAVVHCQESADRMRSVEEGHAAVSTRQQAVEDSVKNKYDSLWQDVSKSLEAVKSTVSTQQGALLERQREEKKTAGRNSINYVTQMVATVHDERRRLAVSKDLLSHWREATWASQRKRTGLQWLCSALNGTVQRRQRQAVARWSHTTSVDTLARRLREEYEAKIPDVEGAIERTGLSARCSQLSQDIEALRIEKCSKEELQEASSGTTAALLEQAGTLDKVTSDHRELALQVSANFAEDRQKAGGVAEQVAELGQKLAGCELQLTGKLGECQNTLAECASSKEVKDLLRDVCQLWSSIKQLDAAKADRKDVDLLGIEKMVSCSKEEKASKVGMDGLQAELQARCGSLDQKVAESAQQCQHWQSMWENLTTTVEQIVGKVAEMQTAPAPIVLCEPRSVPKQPDTTDARREPESAAALVLSSLEACPATPAKPPAPIFPTAHAEYRGRPHSASRSRADAGTPHFRSSSLDRPHARQPALPYDTMRPASAMGLDPILSTSRLENGRSPAATPWKRVQPLPPRTAPDFAAPRKPLAAGRPRPMPVQ